MNVVILMGRLAKDVDVRYTQSGKAVASFPLAVNKPYSKNQQDNRPTADFINCVAWEKLAEIAGNYLVKGSQVVIEGRLQTRSYDAQDGTKRYVTEVLVHNIEFCGSKSQSDGNGFQQPQQKQQSPADQFGQEVSDETIPF